MVANERSIIRNTVLSALGRGGGDFFMFLLLIAVARFYGAEVLGQYTVAMAIGIVLRVLIIQGINTLLVKDIAKNKATAPDLVGVLATGQVVVAVGLLIVFALAAMAFVDDLGAQTIAISIVAYHLVYTLALIFVAYFRGCEQAEYGAYLESGHKGLILALALAGMVASFPADVTLLAFPIGGVAMYVAGLQMMRRVGAAPHYRIDLRLTIRYIRLSLPLFASSILGIVQPRAGIITLGAKHGTANVGIYATADRLISAANLVVVMFAGAVLPVMSRIAHDIEQLRQLITRCIRMVVTFVVPVSTALFLLRAELTVWFFGPEFAAAGDVLGLLAIGMAFGGISTLAMSVLIAINQLPQLLKIQLLSVGVFVAGVVFLVVPFGYVGLGATVLLTKAVSSIAHLLNLRRSGLLLHFWRNAIGPLAASAGIVAVFELTWLMPLALRCGLAALGGAVLLVVFKGIRGGDIAYVRQLLGATR